MDNNKQKFAKQIVVAGAVTSGVLAANAFVTKLTKTILYRHHRDEDINQLLEAQYDVRTIHVKNARGIRLRGLLIENPEATKTMIIQHPFALEAKDMTMYLPFFTKYIQNANFLLVDASAHGQSDGYIRGLGIRDVEDVVTWNNYIIKNYGKQHKIVFYGKECGANSILNAAGKHVLENVIAIISDGAYTSTYDILQYRLEKDYKMPRFPTMQLLKRKIQKEIKVNIKESTVDLVKHNDIPTLFFHAKEDDFVPLTHVYPLYNACRGIHQLYVVKEQRYLSDAPKEEMFEENFKTFVDQYINKV